MKQVIENVCEVGRPIPTSLSHDPPAHPFDQDLCLFLSGRELLLDELPFPLPLIKEHASKGFIKIEPALIMGKGKLHCQRCGSDSQALFASYHCARCQKNCHYCRRCLTMGAAKACSSLVTWTGPPLLPIVDNGHSLCEWEGTLSDAQDHAAKKLVRAVQGLEDFLLWAVCGSGKTEVLFPAIEAVLAEGKRIAVATPRTDVVIELSPRFREAFPQVLISELYGGSTTRDHQAPLVIATTHQLIRFKNTFDVMIIDEVDAFPFHHDNMLPFAVKKAMKPHAPTVYLTATPTETLKKSFSNQKIQGVKIPRRFHGYPLPVPKTTWIGNWRKQLKRGLVPLPFLKWLSVKADRGRQVFVFVPTIEVLNQLTSLLKVAGVHAEDPERHKKVAEFREGVIRVLVTTTILERGVTVPFVDAAVLGADDNVFDESALVQISGRVGRDSRDPAGEIAFFHYGLTLEMVKATKHILMMNKEGGF